ncbi:MAG: RES family NAD+ phosphorylase [Acidobacteria bacterium]|nr:RES family NAD+ phosphorylase [Acidobacteriota bacterium]
MKPQLTPIREEDTRRLIPTRDSEKRVLARIADDEEQLKEILELESATNDRLLGEANLLPGISVHELLFGVTYAHIVNAAFTHARPDGSRFNGPERGAWYAGFGLVTAQTEISFHKSQELKEIAWQEPETFTFEHYLADFGADFDDIRNDPTYADCLDRNSYDRSQAVAKDLLALGSAGIVYQSVRHSGGICIACFRPALVTHVRTGRRITVTFSDCDADPTFS